MSRLNLSRLNLSRLNLSRLNHCCVLVFTLGRVIARMAVAEIPWDYFETKRLTGLR